MVLGFSAGEVFEMAQEIERNGASFYRQAAARFPEEERKVLLDLAAMEDQHLATFSQMSSQLSAREQESPVFDPYGEAELYLKAMASTHVFDTTKDPAELLSGCESARDILKTAIRLEKDSIIFYVGLRAAVAEHLGRGRIDKIIEEEFGHITVLSDKLSRLEV